MSGWLSDVWLALGIVRGLRVSGWLSGVWVAAAQYGAPVDDDQAMQLALDQARVAAERGEVPVGAVVVRNGRVIAAAGNEREATNDPTAHAEVLVLRRAAAALGTWRLADTTLYVTLEPCPMCAGGLLAARVSRLVFGAVDPKAGACGSLYNLCVDPRLNHEVAVTAGVLAGEASSLLSNWFTDRRQEVEHGRQMDPGAR